jgi:exosortase
LPTPTTDTKSKNLYLRAFAVLLLATIGLYSLTLEGLVSFWWNTPDYIYAFFVPPFAAWLLWDRRDQLNLAEFKGSYWGVLVLLATSAIAMYADYDYNKVLKSWTMVPLLAGLVLLVGGWAALRWSWPSIVYLFCMMPIPGRFTDLLSRQLQAIGTSVSVFVLQTLGLPAISEGYVIVLSHSRLGVVEACSGIRMFMLFFAACIGAALYLRRSAWERIVIVLSAPPIAVIANVARITITAFLYENVSQQLGDQVFHDLAGWLMMPMAIAMLWLETALLDRLFITPEREAPLAIGGVLPGGPARGER